MSNCGGIGAGAFKGGTNTPPPNPPFALLAIAGLVAVKDTNTASSTKSQRRTSAQGREFGTVAHINALATGGAIRNVAKAGFITSSYEKITDCRSFRAYALRQSKPQG
jgi:hypothetical protein